MPILVFFVSTTPKLTQANWFSVQKLSKSLYEINFQYEDQLVRLLPYEFS